MISPVIRTGAENMKPNEPEGQGVLERRIQEVTQANQRFYEAFESLDAPVRIVAALDTPVPYSPPLEEVFLPSEDEIERAARLLHAY